MLTDLHVAPPSLVVAAFPTPTATQLLVPEHDTASNSGCPVSSDPTLQDVPPSDDVAAMPFRLTSPPTATQSVDDGHVTALKPPSPS
jgi:hypothetical protein